MKQNAPGHKAEGVVCQLGGYTDAHSTTRFQLQHLAALGIPFHRAALIAPLAFGEGRP